MSRRLIFAPEARADLASLLDFIREQNERKRAIAYLDRIQDYCFGFLQFPERGTARPDLGVGLRVIGFEGRATIVFHFDERTAFIDRILYGGRDLGQAFD